MNDSSPYTQRQWIEAVLNAARDHILDAYDDAVEDAQSVGYPQRHGRYSPKVSTGLTMVVGTDPTDIYQVEAVPASPVELAFERMRRDPATKWLKDVRKAVRALMYLGAVAQRRWPPPVTPGVTVDGVTVGKRGNVVEICAHCKEPVPAMRMPNGKPSIIRVNGLPYHRNTCYHRLYRERRANSANG